MATGDGLPGHNWLLSPTEAAPSLVCLRLQEGAEVEEVLEGASGEGEEMGEDGAQEELVDLPDQHAVHE